MDKAVITIFWFRRDLRIEDNAALFEALEDKYPVQAVFIFDQNILDELEKDDARVSFIHQELTRINTQLNELGSSLKILHAKPISAWEELLKTHDVKKVYANHDYEPYARERDKSIDDLLTKHNITFQTYKDHVVFEKNEVVKSDGTPYLVFTPFSKAWKKKITPFYTKQYPSEKLTNYNPSNFHLPSLSEIGFEPSTIPIPTRKVDIELIGNYSRDRDYPAIGGTSKLGIHLRFGTISIRQLTRIAQESNETYLNELIWRDFYAIILWHFPHVVHNSFNAKYDNIPWRNDESEFEKWCNGNTGYPIVDAGMRELNASGFMHNRVRMIVASFLTKHLLIDWRWGEAYFAKKLLDYDLASNNGGWQWSAGTGVDAAPYFRVFNPHSQTMKFDAQLKYIKKWVPEINSLSYPTPMVDHSFARQRALETYKSSLSSNQ